MQSEAEFNLELFAERWDALYPGISKSWRAHQGWLKQRGTFWNDPNKCYFHKHLDRLIICTANREMSSGMPYEDIPNSTVY